ncbi:hypothetical protein [Amycolatopsis dendrobii]|uniref:Uncharacterized protein n=1 Tax=Amycolatopsis dendrobii TaxID=2760662 RepID=A0A7W3VSA7_9PSEU|nr:hypothetical protein [Amycolatopsis dendrobii]MBB1151772.1 hypothetical protein [Amycolatopsis dendrobii]
MAKVIVAFHRDDTQVGKTVDVGDAEAAIMVNEGRARYADQPGDEPAKTSVASRKITAKTADRVIDAEALVVSWLAGRLGGIRVVAELPAKFEQALPLVQVTCLLSPKTGWITCTGCRTDQSFSTSRLTVVSIATGTARRL